MECLHKLPAGTAKTENGKFWFCKQKPTCHFICSKDEGYIYETAMAMYHETEQPQPVCCDNNLAQFRVVKDMMKDNYGRPFFVCSKNTNRCEIFEWADKIILQRQQCYHNEVSKRRCERKSGPNKGRIFFCCPRKFDDKDQCKFFQWEEETTRPTKKEEEEEETIPPSQKMRQEDLNKIFGPPQSKKGIEKRILKSFLDEMKTMSIPVLHKRHFCLELAQKRFRVNCYKIGFVGRLVLDDIRRKACKIYSKLIKVI
jgi:hypothetical protein